MADALDLGSSAARRGGSSPPSRNLMKSRAYGDLTLEPVGGCVETVAELWLFSFWKLLGPEPKAEVGDEFLQAPVPNSIRFPIKSLF
jgi:hypothetical protein